MQTPSRGVDNPGVHGRSRELDSGAYVCVLEARDPGLEERQTRSLEHGNVMLTRSRAGWWPRHVEHTMLPS
ncbi:hypothetical protein PAPYR_11523 [Paratrimastix pyriformis]|uniref:Uncharacterized protein n=1 Tax=Paratrimastix pyriformis TaxID=342808 RepID=A0ABQ8UAP9_9EUKA|nr:hypothetical protein PAPYR_11523 [Paratrimastix pyriformis]